MDSWFDSLNLKQPESVLALKDIHKGERMFIVGCGPSLKKQVDILDRLDGELTFTCNKMGAWEESVMLEAEEAGSPCPFVPTYHGITEPSHMEHRGRHEIPAWEAEGAVKYAVHPAAIFNDKPIESEGWTWVAKAPDDIQVRKVGFYGLTDFLPPLPTGYTSPLTLAQLGAWMGCRDFAFIGCDMTDEGYVFDAHERANVHPRTLTGIKDCFIRARHDIEEAGGSIVDATPLGLMGYIGILPYVELKDLLGVTV